MILSPFEGIIHPITDAPDPVFSEKMMGDGYFITPKENFAVAPDDGEIITIAAEKHAIAMDCNGHNIFIHVGIDTVKMKGEGFEVFVKEGEKVKRGQKLMTFDIEKIRQNAASDACIVIFIGGEQIRITASGNVSALDAVAEFIA